MTQKKTRINNFQKMSFMTGEEDEAGHRLLLVIR